MKRFALKHITGADPDFEEVQELENRVFMRAFKNTPDLMEREYGPYRHASEFIAVYDKKEARYAGFARVIRHSHKGFKSLNDLEKTPWGGRSVEQVLEDTGLELERERVLDIATLGVDKGYRSTDNHSHGAIVSTSLYHGIIKYSLDHGIAHWVAVLDDRVLAMVQGLGGDFKPFHGIKSAPYLDSPASTPVWSHLSTMVAKASPLQRHVFVHGHGVRQIVEVPNTFRRN